MNLSNWAWKRRQLTQICSGNAFSSCDNAYVADGNSDKPILAADCNVPGERASKAVVRLSKFLSPFTNSHHQSSLFPRAFTDRKK